jgi:hypothetical protein
VTDPGTEALVARFNGRAEADIARGFLEQAGITSVLRVDDGGGAFGVPLSYSMDSFAELVVLSENAEKARQLLLDDGYTILDANGNEVEPESAGEVESGEGSGGELEEGG